METRARPAGPALPYLPTLPKAADVPTIPGAADLGLLPSAVYAKLSGKVIEVKKMLSVFIRKLRTDPTDR